MTELELWQKIARRAYKEDAKAPEAYMKTQWRVVWAEEKLAKLMADELGEITVSAERRKAMNGIENAYKAMSAN